MPDDIVTLLKQEEARLLSALAASPAFHKLQAIQNTLRAYGAEPAKIDTFAPLLSRVLATGSDSSEKLLPETVRPTREGTKAAEIIREAELFLDQRGQRAQSNEILEHLEKKGIRVSGTNPVAVVASYLSTSKLFDNVRGQGYGLARWKSSSVKMLDELLDDSAGEAAAPIEEAAAH